MKDFYGVASWFGGNGMVSIKHDQGTGRSRVAEAAGICDTLRYGMGFEVGESKERESA